MTAAISLADTALLAAWSATVTPASLAPAPLRPRRTRTASLCRGRRRRRPISRPRLWPMIPSRFQGCRAAERVGRGPAASFRPSAPRSAGGRRPRDSPILGGLVRLPAVSSGRLMRSSPYALGTPTVIRHHSANLMPRSRQGQFLAHEDDVSAISAIIASSISPRWRFTGTAIIRARHSRFFAGLVGDTRSPPGRARAVSRWPIYRQRRRDSDMSTAAVRPGFPYQRRGSPHTRRRAMLYNMLRDFASPICHLLTPSRDSTYFHDFDASRDAGLNTSRRRVARPPAMASRRRLSRRETALRA